MKKCLKKCLICNSKTRGEFESVPCCGNCYSSGKAHVIAAATWWQYLFSAPDRFKFALIESIAEFLREKPWNVDSPLTGEALRVVCIDYYPDKTLQRALDKSLMKTSLNWPHKTVMWINPNGVKVRRNYGTIEDISHSVKF